MARKLQLDYSLRVQRLVLVAPWRKVLQSRELQVKDAFLRLPRVYQACCGVVQWALFDDYVVLVIFQLVYAVRIDGRYFKEVSSILIFF